MPHGAGIAILVADGWDAARARAVGTSQRESPGRRRIHGRDRRRRRPGAGGSIGIGMRPRCARFGDPSAAVAIVRQDWETHPGPWNDDDSTVATRADGNLTSALFSDARCD